MNKLLQKFNQHDVFIFLFWDNKTKHYYKVVKKIF